MVLLHVFGRGSFFFFSSRRRHTRLQGDWSSDVCSSDLTALEQRVFPVRGPTTLPSRRALSLGLCAAAALSILGLALFLERETSPRERPFTVHHARPARSHQLVADLAEGWNPRVLGDAVRTPPEESR